MPFGLFLRREMIVSTRQGRAFSERRHAATILGLVVAGCFLVWDGSGKDRRSVEGARAFGLVLFASAVVAEATLLLALIPATAGPSIASERDRKSLDSLLATRLSASDVVFGALGATLLRYANRFAALPPILVLIIVLGGVDPRFAWLCFAALGTTAATLAVLSVAVSAGARSTREAVGYSLTLAMIWFLGPFLVLLLLPRIWPAGASWLAPVALMAADSSPLIVPMSQVGAMPRGPLVLVILRMIGMQAIAAILLLIWAIVRLRPASRASYDRENRDARLRALRARWRPRPPCGDDPMLWHEIHVCRQVNLIDLIADRLVLLLSMAGIAYVTGIFAGPAFVEALHEGYGPGPADASFPDLHPMARMLVARVSGFATSSMPGQARLDFSIVLRQMSAALGFLYWLMIAGASAESVTNERDRDTWLGLLATPLTGWEILRAKMLGAIWRVRWLAGALILISSIGVLSGALHPIGFLAGAVVLVISTVFFGVVGVSSSLWSLDRAEANNRALGPAIIAFTMAAAPFLLPGFLSQAAALVSPPFQLWASLVSYDDVSALTQGRPLPQFGRVGVSSTPGAFVLLGGVLASLGLQAVLAFWIARKAVSDFDKVVGRPIRPPRPMSSEGVRDCSPTAPVLLN